MCSGDLTLPHSMVRLWMDLTTIHTPIQRLLYISSLDQLWATLSLPSSSHPTTSSSPFLPPMFPPFLPPSLPLYPPAKGCREDHYHLQNEPPEWVAFNNSDYGYSKLAVHNSTHVSIQQISADKASHWPSRVVQNRSRNPERLYIYTMSWNMDKSFDLMYS